MKRTYHFFDIPTRQESKIWNFKDDPMPTMVKRQRAAKKVMYAVFIIKLEGQEQQTGILLNVFQKFFKKLMLGANASP
ncbi:hypothetical protein TNCV_2607381 [Trichonephila clavipes]|uniref:Uncharacterized protein n=1 Tax=Trichonephila clavipes TaxID=2585209 RepID=A0A8X6V6W7_TRICX|nr:hypothetical protein TNCV_2607331 [Trichonephila clavipes]GFY01554.1 hypothetical protein TNCV_2607381 [Trichonephila clavipes]